MILSSGFAGAYFKILDESDQTEHLATKLVLATVINSISVIALSLWLFFFLIELRRLCIHPYEYLTGLANWLDMGSQITSVSYFIVLELTVYFDYEIVTI